MQLGSCATISFKKKNDIPYLSESRKVRKLLQTENNAFQLKVFKTYILKLSFLYTLQVPEIIPCSCIKYDDRCPCIGSCLTCTDICWCKDCTNTVNDEESNDNSDDQSERDSDSDFSDLEF